MIRLYNFARKHGLGFAQLVILDALHRDGELFKTALVRKLHVTQADITGHLQKLIDLGYAEMRPALHDRRKRIISITAAGKALFTEKRVLHRAH